MTYRILIIEDNLIALRTMAAYLEKDGYVIETAVDGETGYDLVKRGRYDLILLDLGLPGIDGTEFLSLLRRDCVIPVIVVSAKGSDIEKVVAFNLGADDYVVKPASPIELSARIRAVLRRGQAEVLPSRWLRIGSIVVNLRQREAFHRGIRLNLTVREFDIFRLFVTHPGVVYDKSEVFRLIWEEGTEYDEAVVSVHISRLRAKLVFDDVPPIITTVWGIGYKFDGTAVPIDHPDA